MKNTTLCYIKRGGKYLMMHRTKKENDENAGKWIGVGGKLEEGESPRDCAFREVKEETALVPDSLDYRGIVTFVMRCGDSVSSELMHVFTGSSESGDLAECDEGELAFIDEDKLCELPMWEGDRLFLELIARPTPFFEMKLEYEGERLVSHEVSFAAKSREPLLVSACLLGFGCRYDGNSKPIPQIDELLQKYELVPFCPEIYGGLPTPRPSSEVRGATVVNSRGEDVGENYRRGASEALYAARLLGCEKALLKARSPSCGKGEIHDGSFGGGMISGDGITARLLSQNGIAVFDESRADELL